MKLKLLYLSIALLAILTLIACGFPGEPMLDDMYTRDIFPGSDSTYDVGAAGNEYAEGHFDALWVAGVPVGAGVVDFTDLGDVDNDYTGDGGKYLRVNIAEDAIEFVVLGGGGDMTKATYDIDTDNIVDKAENVDDGAGNASTAAQVKTAVTNNHTHANKATLDAIEEAYTTAEKNKLAAIEALADVTDTANVDGAGATMNTDFNAKGDLLTATADDTPVILSSSAVDGNILTVDTAQASGLKWAAPASGGATITVSEAVVYNDASPVAWTDLDLSGTVGAHNTLVFLAFNSEADLNAVAVRKNGDTLNYFDVADDANAYGCALGHHDDGTPLVLLTMTDVNGVIEWITESSETATVTLLYYIQ